MNLSDPDDALYAPNGMERECTLCGTTDCSEPMLPRADDSQSHREYAATTQDFPPPYKHDFGDGYRPARNTQVGGNWYSKLAIQPGEYCFANNLNYWQGNVIKYVTRYKDKNGAEDLRKAIHCIELLLEQEYGRGNPEAS